MKVDENIELLKMIYNSIEEIKKLLLLVNSKILEEVKTQKLKEDSIKKKIYDLCDGKNTNEDIAKKLIKILIMLIHT
ncbi:MAG: hypothetical protein ACTSVV_11660 [Promethearchaeota archaeon]